VEEPTEGRNRQFLSFQIAGEQYALEIVNVREIIEYGVVTRVPLTPPWIRGVINLRGGVVPVVDLAVRFGLPSGEVTARTCIVIVDTDLAGLRTPMGVVADSVSQVLELGAEDIEPPPAFGTRIRLEYLLGMARTGNRFAILLDIDKILSSDELLTLTEAARVTAEPGGEAEAMSRGGASAPEARA
jgi:purine-binding chemotaxis protein CheW